MTSGHAVFEFRNYATRRGRRDALIDLFERTFVESQEAVGSRVVATFRNLDDPNRFVWLRSFADMTARATALDAFYTSTLWRTHRNEANARIADSDDVLLLRQTAGRLPEDTAKRLPPGGPAASSLIVATTYFLKHGADEAFADLFADDMAPALRDAGVGPIATFATEHSANSYPRLPVRENETVFLTLTRFEHVTDHKNETPPVSPALARFLIAPTETLRLQPTARSLFR